MAPACNRSKLQCVLVLTKATTHLPLPAVALPACLCGCPCQRQLRLVLEAQGGLPQSLSLFSEATQRQVLLPLPSPTGPRLGLQELTVVDSLAGGLVQRIKLAGGHKVSGDVVWYRPEVGP